MEQDSVRLSSELGLTDWCAIILRNAQLSVKNDPESLR
jgi:hypothetical protein